MHSFFFTLCPWSKRLGTGVGSNVDCLCLSVNSGPRWSTVVATWRSVSTAWTCLRLMAVIRTSDWWLSVTHYHPALSLKSNCTATCSCSEPAWTWSSSSWTHGTYSHTVVCICLHTVDACIYVTVWVLKYLIIAYYVHCFLCKCKREKPYFDSKQYVCICLYYLCART